MFSGGNNPKGLNDLLKLKLGEILTEREFVNLVDISFDSFSGFSLLKGLGIKKEEKSKKDDVSSLFGISDKAVLKDFIFIFFLPFMNYIFKGKGQVFLNPRFLFFLTNSSSFVYKSFAQKTIEQIMDNLDLKSVARKKTLDMLARIVENKSLKSLKK